MNFVMKGDVDDYESWRKKDEQLFLLRKSQERYKLSEAKIVFQLSH